MTDKKKYVDMAVKPLKGTSTMRQLPDNYTTALSLALFFEGKELDAPGYHQHSINAARPLFQPKTGRVVFDVINAEFGVVMHPIQFDGAALMAKGAIITSFQNPDGVIERGPGPIFINTLRLFQMKVV